jgi:membrane-bound metal-dependent hydrolase YbcI (DUF457 family)
MPFTPFHFGLGIAAKAAVPRGFSLILFIALQVVIDLESLFNLMRNRYPMHRFLHTFVGATLLAVASAALALPLLRWRVLNADPNEGGSAGRRTLLLLLATALFATWSHVVLDAIMHRDVQPFWPFAAENPLLGLVGVGALHLACVALGFAGAIILAFRLGA